MLLLAATGVWVAAGRPRPQLPTVSVAAPAVVAVPVLPVLTYASAALAATHAGQLPAAVTVGGHTVRLVAVGRDQARLCVAGDCVMINGLTRQVTAIKP